MDWMVDRRTTWKGAELVNKTVPPQDNDRLLLIFSTLPHLELLCLSLLASIVIWARATFHSRNDSQNVLRDILLLILLLLPSFMDMPN